MGTNNIAYTIVSAHNESLVVMERPLNEKVTIPIVYSFYINSL
jgi:hypothetical protein